VANVTNPKHVVVYADEDGREPFTEWLYELRNVVGRQRILARVSRLQQGNYGDCEPVGEGVRELRMSFGPGYRVYFGEHRDNLVLILCGGDKGSQSGDIFKAKACWKEYLSHDKL